MAAAMPEWFSVLHKSGPKIFSKTLSQIDDKTLTVGDLILKDIPNILEGRLIEEIRGKSAESEPECGATKLSTSTPIAVLQDFKLRFIAVSYANEEAGNTEPDRPKSVFDVFKILF